MKPDYGIMPVKYKTPVRQEEMRGKKNLNFNEFLRIVTNFYDYIRQMRR